MRIAILEDEQIVAEDLENRLRKSHCLSACEFEVCIFNDGESLISSDKNFDIIFVDYKLGEGENGLETIKTVRNTDENVKVIFLTNYPEYVFESFKVDTFRYLVKPVSDDDLNEALSQVVKSDYNSMMIKIGEKSRSTYINAKDIKYIEANKRNCYFYIGDSKIFVNKSISELEEILNPVFFFRISRFFIINFAYMESDSSSNVVMNGGKTINISRMKHSELKKRYLQYLKNKN